jgi:hypothetical protein
VVMAASHPAWPPPTTITSKDSVGAAEMLMPSLSGAGEALDLFKRLRPWRDWKICWE